MRGGKWKEGTWPTRDYVISPALLTPPSSCTSTRATNTMIEDMTPASRRADTWGSAVALSQLLLHDMSLVSGKSVLEVGSGTGLPSLAASRSSLPLSRSPPSRFLAQRTSDDSRVSPRRLARSVVASDRSEELLANVERNAALNAASLEGGASIATRVLRWEEQGGRGGMSFDVVVGAEVRRGSARVSSLSGLRHAPEYTNFGKIRRESTE